MSSSKQKKTKPKATFLLDENIDIRLASFLKERGFSTKICPKGLKNGDVAALVKKHNYILLTNDKDFANSDMYHPSMFPGIVVLRIHPPKLEKVSNILDEFFNKFSLKDFNGTLFVINEDGVEIFG